MSIVRIYGSLNNGRVILAADGTVGAPGYSFTGDRDSGFYRIGANNIGLALNGANVLDLGVANNVITGAGVATFGVLRVVNNGSGAFPLLRFENTGGAATSGTVAGTWADIRSSASQRAFILRYDNATNVRFLLDLDGNLSIGNTSATAHPASQTHTFIVFSGTAPTSSLNDSVTFYSSDDAPGHTIPSFYCEGTNVLATGQADSASSVRVKVRINGTVVTLLGI